MHQGLVACCSETWCFYAACRVVCPLWQITCARSLWLSLRLRPPSTLKLDLTTSGHTTLYWQSSPSLPTACFDVHLRARQTWLPHRSQSCAHRTCTSAATACVTTLGHQAAHRLELALMALRHAISEACHLLYTVMSDCALLAALCAAACFCAFLFLSCLLGRAVRCWNVPPLRRHSSQAGNGPPVPVAAAQCQCAVWPAAATTS